MGGILGLGLDCGTDISSCLANCTINFTGIGNNRHGMAFARILAKGSASCTIQSTGVAGTINGNPLTSSNWNTIYTLYSVAEGTTTVVTEGLNSCYFYQEP